MKTIISINQNHIDRGSKGCAMSCPVALAIKDVVLDESIVTINRYCFICHSYKRYSERIPNHIYHWINDFDSGKVVSPISFELDIPKFFLKSYKPNKLSKFIDIIINMVS